MVDNTTGEQTTTCSEWYMDEHAGYIGTARMLAEAGMLLLDMANHSTAGSENRAAGVVTPAYAFGSSILERLKDTTSTTFKIS